MIGYFAYFKVMLKTCHDRFLSQMRRVLILSKVSTVGYLFFNYLFMLFDKKWLDT